MRFPCEPQFRARLARRLDDLRPYREAFNVLGSAKYDAVPDEVICDSRRTCALGAP